ncbi:MAG: hypothetical protein DME26_01420, partial [Verrucomicrobia bacterium]
MAYDAATGIFALYINGAQIVSATNGPMSLCTSEKNVFIGGEDSFLPRRFPGLIDEVQIFGRALAASELQAIANGCTPDIAVSTNFLFLGFVPIGQSASQNLTISNRGGATLTVSNTLSSARFTVPPGTFPMDLAPGSNRVVTVTFSPANVGIAGQSLTLTSNDPDQPVLRISLEGYGLEGTCATPVAWWPGEGSGADIQGNNNATLNNISFVSGKGGVGQAFKFGAAQNSNINVPASPGIDIGNAGNTGITVEMWINPTSTDI